MTWRPRYSWRTLILFTLLVTSGVGLWYAARRPAWVKICTLKDASPYDFIPPGAKAILWRGHLLKYLAEEKGPEAEGVIVDTETGQIVGRLPGMKAVLGGKVSPGGRWATPTGFYSTEIWDIERRVKLRDQLGMPAAFQEDDSLMVLALPNAVEIRKTETNELVGSLDMPDGEGRGTVSSDGSVLLRQRKGAVPEILAIPSGERLSRLEGVGNGPVAVRFSRDVTRVLTMDEDKTIRISNVRSGKLLATIRDEEEGQLRAAISPCGRFVATWRRVRTGPDKDGRSSEKGAKRLLIWDAGSGASLARVEQEGDVKYWKLRFFNDGLRVAAVCSDDTLKIMDCRSGECLFTIDDVSAMAREMVLSEDGNALMAAGVVHSQHVSPYPTVIWRRRRPEWWWGVFYLKEFWMTVAFAGVFVWSVVRDRRALGACASE